MTQDRILTALQQDGTSYMVGTVAEAVEVCNTLGLDPRHVIVHGILSVEERPERNNGTTHPYAVTNEPWDTGRDA